MRNSNYCENPGKFLEVLDVLLQILTAVEMKIGTYAGLASSLDFWNP